jgi:hypothetical protein
MRRTPKLSVNDNSGKLFGIITSDEESWDESDEEQSAPAEAEWEQTPACDPLNSMPSEDSSGVDDSWVAYPL